MEQNEPKHTRKKFVIPFGSTSEEILAALNQIWIGVLLENKNQIITVDGKQVPGTALSTLFVQELFAPRVPNHHDFF